LSDLDDAWTWNHRLNEAAARYQTQRETAVALKTLAEHSDWIMVTAEDFEAIASAI